MTSNLGSTHLLEGIDENGDINPEAEELESTTAKEFIDFLITDDAKTIFRKYYFDTDVEN